MKLRLIIQSTENGEQEYVNFTENFTTPQEEFLIPRCTIDYDEIGDFDIPSIFPLDYNLKRN
jgi:hypothetical protein